MLITSKKFLQSDPHNKGFDPNFYESIVDSSPTTIPVFHESSWDSPITMAEVESAVASFRLKRNKASGPDSIPYDIIIALQENGIRALHSLFHHLSFSQHCVPTKWKTAEIILLPKIQDAHLPEHYRPISLLSSAGKVMEKIILRRLWVAIDKSRSTPSFQSGFVPQRSAIPQLLRLTHHIHTAWDSSSRQVSFCYC